MKYSGTEPITGGGSGIRADLAASFHARGAQVVVVGHRRESVEAVAARHPSMAVEVADAKAFLPLLRRQQRARLVNDGSGLGYVPLVAAPVYSASKAAVRSFTISLRHQLAGSTAKVVELIAPVVSTALHRSLEKEPPNAMQLDAFVRAAMAGLDSGRDGIVVGLANALRVFARVLPGIRLNLVYSGDRAKPAR